GGDSERAVPLSAPPLHTGALVGDPRARYRAAPPADRADGRRSQPDRSPLGVPLPHPLPPRAEDLRRGGAAARGARDRPPRRLSLRVTLPPPGGGYGLAEGRTAAPRGRRQASVRAGAGLTESQINAIAMVGIGADEPQELLLRGGGTSS